MQTLEWNDSIDFIPRHLGRRGGRAYIDSRVQSVVSKAVYSLHYNDVLPNDSTQYLQCITIFTRGLSNKPICLDKTIHKQTPLKIFNPRAEQ